MKYRVCYYQYCNSIYSWHHRYGYDSKIVRGYTYKDAFNNFFKRYPYLPDNIIVDYIINIGDKNTRYFSEII